MLAQPQLAVAENGVELLEVVVRFTPREQRNAALSYRRLSPLLHDCGLYGWKDRQLPGWGPALDLRSASWLEFIPQSRTPSKSRRSR